MLDVQRREHVDAGVEDVLDVLVALRMLDARRVRVRKLVDQAELRGAGEDAGQVHFLEHRAAVARRCGAAPAETFGELRRSPRAVRLEQADHDVAPGFLLCVTLDQHPERLADAGGHAEDTPGGARGGAPFTGRSCAEADCE